MITECKGKDNLIILGQSHIPANISTGVTMCAVEFAGVKFKVGNVSTGREYIQQVEMLLKRMVQQMPNIQKLIVSEEKYSFTPDKFKASTRSQRTSKRHQGKTIDHLKTATNIVNDEALNKDAATKTTLGKRAISNFLALNSDSQSRIELLQMVKQRKGEAEMAVVDWLIGYQDQLKPGQAAVSVVSLGDIDAIYIHLFAVSRLWKRDEKHQFVNLYMSYYKNQRVNRIYI